jgi:hypothetical protein
MSVFSIENGEPCFGYGGVRIYRISKSEAEEIVKQFPKSFTHDPPFLHKRGSQLFYMNVNHDQHHVIFSINPVRKKSSRSKK